MLSVTIQAAGGYLAQVEEEILTSGASVFVARHPELPGVIAQGMTRDEAIEIFNENLGEYLGALRAAGHPVPRVTSLSFKYVAKLESEERPQGIDAAVTAPDAAVSENYATTAGPR